MISKVKNADAVILDLRGNGGGSRDMLVSVAGCFPISRTTWQNRLNGERQKYCTSSPRTQEDLLLFSS
jgi:C-terminal processing protease CtpA/Prc